MWKRAQCFTDSGKGIERRKRQWESCCIFCLILESPISLYNCFAPTPKIKRIDGLYVGHFAAYVTLVCAFRMHTSWVIQRTKDVYPPSWQSVWPMPRYGMTARAHDGPLSPKLAICICTCVWQLRGLSHRGVLREKANRVGGGIRSPCLSEKGTWMFRPHDCDGLLKH